MNIYICSYLQPGCVSELLVPININHNDMFQNGLHDWQGRAHTSSLEAGMYAKLCGFPRNCVSVRVGFWHFAVKQKPRSFTDDCWSTWTIKFAAFAGRNYIAKPVAGYQSGGVPIVFFLPITFWTQNRCFLQCFLFVPSNERTCQTCSNNYQPIIIILFTINHLLSPKNNLPNISSSSISKAAVTVHGKLYSWGASACGQLGHCNLDRNGPAETTCWLGTVLQ